MGSMLLKKDYEGGPWSGAGADQSRRYGHRDATMVLIGYRHGLRASELCDLQWSQVELIAGVTSAGPRVVRRASIRCKVTRSAPCGVYNASRTILARIMTERGGPMTPKAFHFSLL